ncbi:SRPBCC family protein [Microlunatus ginsengisoli]|uniref:Carbon monoxide dehydrogenase subunit G n=1 Tax=Microlunatus ginsengisoli TaxID=363863 RepID=A0ABP6ZYS2_9ACTN
MDLVHRFSVQAPIDEAWYALNHIDRLAPCFPGASIDSFDGDDFSGSVRIKFGPTLNYKGSGTFVERDDAAHRAVVEARGSDLRGGSGVLAKVYVEMWENGRLTDIEIKTDLGISGRPAQLGRGVIEDVSNKLLLTFADRVQEGFEAGIGRPDYVAPPPPLPPTMGPEPKRAETAGAGAAPGGQAASGPEAAPVEPAGTIGRHRYPRTSLADAGAAPAAAAGNGASRPAPTNAPQYGTAYPRDEPALNALTTVLPSVLKRYGWVLVVGTALTWLVGRILRKGRKKS